LKRVFAIEIEKCGKCGGKVKIVASDRGGVPLAANPKSA
jgi:hypothetical protein